MFEAACNCCKCSCVPQVKSSQAWDWRAELFERGWVQEWNRREKWTCPECKGKAEQIDAVELDFACKICGNTPDEYSVIDHGRGCFTQSENGGGSSFCEAHCQAKGKPDDRRTD